MTFTFNIWGVVLVLIVVFCLGVWSGLKIAVVATASAGSET